MIPARIQFRDSPAEVRLFDAFKTQLPDSYTVLHHVPWTLRSSGRRSIEGEADFIVVHADHGALVLEVKGGTLRYDASEARWYQTSLNRDDEHQVKDPFRQAADGVRGILQHLASWKGWRKNWGPIGFGVCFPDAAFAGPPLPATRPELVIDGTDMAEAGGLARRIREIMEWYPHDSFAQGETGKNELVRALNHDVVVEQPLGLAAEGVERQIAELSGQQYRILRLFRHKLRLAVSGPAGSGKTLLALEKGRDLARTGKKTLILCYNRPLADYLRTEIGSLPDLEVTTFHQLTSRLLEKAKIRSPGKSEFFDRAPELLLDAIAVVGGQYDAVLVDEGQVIDQNWWVPIEALLRDNEDGVLWVFYDDNQALYERPRGLPTGVDHQPLLEVWRNSRPIFDAVMGYYAGDPPECLGPDGPAVTVAPANGDPRPEVSRALHRLVTEQNVRTSDIVVLTARNASTSPLAGTVGSFVLTETPTNPRDVKLASIYRFLGLESRVVIVCDLPPREHPDFSRLMYVALSRARAVLVVVENETVSPDQVEEVPW
jgi:hypothetical protein